MKVLLAIPVYNEAPYVGRVLASVQRQLTDVLVIDDGSTDATPRLLADWPQVFRLRHAHNLGYGQSLIDGIGFAAGKGYDWLVSMDCDEQHEPACLPDFLAAARADHADVISGSRYLADLAGNDRPPPDRRRINACITALLNELLGLRLTDAFCGFKAYRVSAVSRLRLTEPGYALPLQFWVQAARHGLRIVELPVPLIYPDPRRRFGAPIDTPQRRLRYYLRVLTQALEDESNKAAARPATPPETCISLSSSCRCR